LMRCLLPLFGLFQMSPVTMRQRTERREKGSLPRTPLKAPLKLTCASTITGLLGARSVCLRLRCGIRLVATFGQAGSAVFSAVIGQLLFAPLAALPVSRTSLRRWVSSAPSASFAQSAASRSHASRSTALDALSAFRRHSCASQRNLFASDIMTSLTIWVFGSAHRS
jgi:hypothetical protein